MNVPILSWLALELASAGFTLAYARSEWRRAILWSWIGTVPGAVMLAEYFLRISTLAMELRLEVPSHYVTLWPGVVGLGLGVIGACVSFIDSPPRWPLSRFEAARVLHVITLSYSIVMIALYFLVYGLSV